MRNTCLPIWRLASRSSLTGFIASRLRSMTSTLFHSRGAMGESRRFPRSECGDGIGRRDRTLKVRKQEPLDALRVANGSLRGVGFEPEGMCIRARGKQAVAELQQG